MHSVFSDGDHTPEELVGMAAANGVNLIALTDHDDIEGLGRMRAAAHKAGIFFVTGVEISTHWAGCGIHIVGLAVDENNRELNDFLNGVQKEREERAHKSSGKLEECGFQGAFEGAQKYVTNPKLISRTHFANWMYDQKYVNNWQVAFDKYLGKGQRAYVGLESATIPFAVELIVKAGGIPVLAHPGRYRLDDLRLQELMNLFRDSGGRTIEVTTGSHAPADVPKFTEIARRQHFEVSTGSDFHRLGIRCQIGRQGELARDLVPVWTHFGLS